MALLTDSFAWGGLLSYFTARQLGSNYPYPRGIVPVTSDSTTQRVGSARDDPARSAMLGGVHTETAWLKQGHRNALDAVSMVQEADEALAEMTSVFAEMLVLARQAVSGGYTESQQASMQVDFEGLLDKVDAIPASVGFAGTSLLTAASDVLISLADGYGEKISIQTNDVSTQALGLTQAGSDPTYATLTAPISQGIGAIGSPYVKGPNNAPLAELTFTFHGSAGDKVATIYIQKNKSLTDIVDMINSETETLVPGWSAAEAVQVSDNWSLKVTTYEAGETEAPSVAVVDNLTWKSNDPVQPSDFTGQAGSAGGSEGLVLTASDTIEKIQNAIDDIADIRHDFAASTARLEAASSALESATGYSLAAELRISDTVYARETATVTKDEILGQAGMALLLQGNVTAGSTLQLLGLPALDEEGSFFSRLWA